MPLIKGLGKVTIKKKGVPPATGKKPDFVIPPTKPGKKKKKPPPFGKIKGLKK